MPMGHLMLSLLAGIVAVGCALVAGLSPWAAALLYLGVGNAALLASLVLRPPDQARTPPARPARLRPLPH